jgi:hypothetical protein
MKAVLWKPFRKWSGNMYSHWTSSYRGSKSQNALHTTSQDPIVSRSCPTNNGYQLHNMDLEKSQNYGRKQDPNILEKAIAQLPRANSHNHPHHPLRKPADSGIDSGEHNRHPQQAAHNPTRQSGINKETTIQVSETPCPPQPQRTPSHSQPPHPYRQRHQPLIPHQQDNVTPRAWDEVYSSRHNGAAALAPTSPVPSTVAQNTTAPLTPMSPMSPTSIYSTDVDSQMPTPKIKRNGGTFFIT